mgnify:CR=1 FL=1
MAEDLCHHEEHPVAVSGEEILTLMAGGFADQRARQSVASATERDSSVFGSESVLSVSVHGKTEVDLLSMTCCHRRTDLLARDSESSESLMRPASCLEIGRAHV